MEYFGASLSVSCENSMIDAPGRGEVDSGVG
jgi:hypothetical protein